MSLLDTAGNCDSGSMGLSHGLELDSLNPKKTNRWLFSIPSVSTGKAPALPPRKASRPGIQMKEYEFQHVHESIWYPLKGEWKTMNLTLYDIRCNQNVVFDWLTDIYDPSDSDGQTFGYALPYKFPTCTLELYSGCGEVMETWTYENVYASNIDWGELDMDQHEIVMVNLTLRYDRAYFDS